MRAYHRKLAKLCCGLWIFLGTFGISPQAMATSTSCAEPSSYDPDTNSLTLNVDWSKAQPEIDHRVTSSTYVRACVTNFNFVRYDLSLDLKETQSTTLTVALEALKAIPIVAVAATTPASQSKGRSLPLAKPEEGSSAPKSSNNPFLDARAKLLASIEAARRMEGIIEKRVPDDKVEQEQISKIVCLLPEKDFSCAPDEFAVDMATATPHRSAEELHGSDLKEKIVKFSNPASISEAKKNIAVALDETLQRAAEPNDFSDGNVLMYQEAKASADKTTAALSDLERRIKLTQTGKWFNIGAKPFGSNITIALIPVRATNTAGATVEATAAKPKALSYSVHPALPFVFHVGFTRSWLDDNKLVSNSYGDTGSYEQVRDVGHTDQFSAFATYAPNRWHADVGQFGVALGTDIKDPGTRFYLGGSYLPSGMNRRLVITAGVATAIVESGRTPMPDAGPDFYDTIEQKRDFDAFVAISLRAF